MRIVWLSWYIAGLLALLSILDSMISYAPDAQRLAMVLHIVFPSGTIVGFVGALSLSRLPYGHWIHQSKPLWASLVVIAMTLTLLVIVVG